MRALHLDYRTTSRPVALGRILLAVGLAVAALALFEYRAAREEVAAYEIRVADIRKSEKRRATSVRGSPGDVAASAQELKVAQLAVKRLSLRWDELFTTLESARVEGVALLAIEPDPGKNVIKLTAEARSALEMLDYVERLQAAGGLGDVVLASHQIKAGDPLQPLSFVVVASWMTQKR